MLTPFDDFVRMIPDDHSDSSLGEEDCDQLFKNKLYRKFDLIGGGAPWTYASKYFSDNGLMDAEDARKLKGIKVNFFRSGGKVYYYKALLYYCALPRAGRRFNNLAADLLDEFFPDANLGVRRWTADELAEPEGLSRKPRPPSRTPKPTNLPYKHPDHPTEEQVRDAIKAGLEGIWLSPHNHHSIRFSGREKEWELLDEFIEDKGQDRDFLIASLTAPSGAGKTRLVSEWMKGYMATEGNDNGWDAGFVDSRATEPWAEWAPTRNTLIIIDYTYNYDDVIDLLFKRFKDSAPKKIRLLLLDHVTKTIGELHLQREWRKPFPTSDALATRLNAFFQPYPIELKPEVEGSDLLRKVIAFSADPDREKGYNEKIPVIIRAEEALMSIGADIGENLSDDQIRRRDSVRHPLFAALVGQAIRENPEETFEGWSRRHLVQQYFDQGQRIPWVEDERNQFARTLGPWVGCYITAATLLRGARFTHLRDCLPQSIRNEFSGEEIQDIKEIANRIVSSTDKRVLKPFEPDILGEAFLLKFLEAFGANDTVMETLVSMIGSEKIPSRAHKNASNFLETIQRLARNLANDNQNADAVERTWTALLDLLKPDRFPDNTFSRYAISISLVDVAEALPKQEMPDAYLKCLRQVVSTDLVVCTDTILYGQAMLALMEFHGMAKDALEPVEVPDAVMLLRAAQQFDQRLSFPHLVGPL